MTKRSCAARRVSYGTVASCLCGALLLPILSHKAKGAGRPPERRVSIDELKGIIITPPLSKVDTDCIKMLRNGLKMLYGVSLDVLDKEQPDRPALILGTEAALGAGMVTREELARVSPDGYVLKTYTNAIVIAGAGDWATLYGVYGFLETLGMRFYKDRFRQAFVPKPETREIPTLHVLDRPVFAYRNGRSTVWRQTGPRVGNPRAGLNPELFTKAAGSDLWIDHTAGYLVPKRLYHDTHPEYYAMVNGKRMAWDRFTDHRTPLCLSNPDVTTISTTRALAWIEKEQLNQKDYFMITYGDTGRWCECPECLKVDPAPREYSSRLLSWVNPIAKAVAATYPDKILITFAYGGTDAAPPVLRPEENVWIMGSTGAGGLPFWDHLMARQSPHLTKNFKKIDAWLDVVPNGYLVCEYQSNVYKPALVDTLQARLRYYAGRGIRGILYSYGRPTNFSELWMYLYGKLMWNPDQDAHKLAAEFIAHHYGAEAGPVLKFFELCHQRYQTTLRAKSELRRVYPADFYDTAFAKKAVSHLADARLPDEEKHFIMDWMKHPLSEEMTPEARAILRFQLDRLVRLAGNSDKEKIAFAAQIHKTGIMADSAQKGALAAVMEWIVEQNFPKLKAIPTRNGITLPAEIFRYAGWGPKRFAGSAGFTCPARIAAGIYVKGNSLKRSDRMEADFELSDIHGDGGGTLEIWGQDCDHPVPAAEITIEINGTSIYKGPVSAVKRNWSAQSFSIPAGLLKKGVNKMEFINVGDPASIKKWHDRWFMLAKATITFNP